MDLLKKIFPFAFAEKKDVATLVIHVILQIVAVALLGVVIGVIVKLLGWIPLLAWLLGIVSSLAELYVLINLVLTFLDYFKILK